MGSINCSNSLIKDLIAERNDDAAAFLQRFFKTGPGEYGEGDLFLGIRVPKTRQIVAKYQKDLSLKDLSVMLNNKWHEVRLASLIAMTKQYAKASDTYKKDLYDLYINNIGEGINNWDLVDISCPRIVGAFLSDKNKDPLYELAQGGLWQKRVSIISTFYFLSYQDNPVETYNLAEILVDEKPDLLQKAVGWALREMGKYDGQLLRQFLNKYASTMPRTMLRYSLEKFAPSEKYYYMNKDKKV